MKAVNTVYSETKKSHETRTGSAGVILGIGLVVGAYHLIPELVTSLAVPSVSQVLTALGMPGGLLQL